LKNTIKIIAILLLYFVCVNVYAHSPNKVFKLVKDSLPNYLGSEWKFNHNDSMDFNAIDYNDNHWIFTNSDLRDYDFFIKHFKGIAWFRYTFRIDSTLKNIPLSISLQHFGASEIYLDNKLIQKFGEIKDSSNSIYFHPQETPVIFELDDTGVHVFAVRYANFDALSNVNKDNYNFSGFNFTISTSVHGIYHKIDTATTSTFISVLLFTIFLLLGLIHLFLFLFDRKTIYNLYLCVFMFSISYAFFLLFNYFNSSSPTSIIIQINTLKYVLIVGFFMLSLFLNKIFSFRNKKRFYSLISLAVITIALAMLKISFYKITILLFYLFIVFESFYIIIKAIIDKQKGAKIIGFGVLFTGFYFILILSLIIINNDHFDFNDSTLSGLILIILAALAIVSMPISMTLYIGWSFAYVNKNLALQIEQTKILLEKNIEQEKEKVKLISSQNELLEHKVEERTKELSIEKKKSDDLLLNILPQEIADELKSNGKSEAQQYDHVSVLFTDFVGFTSLGENLSPKELVKELNYYFTVFDEIIGKHGLEKIKTIGDAYMAVCGIPNADPMHAIKTTYAALEIMEFSNEQKKLGHPFEIRIGINSGSVVAGIIGVKKFAYDIWGDTVNTAARLEQNSEAGKINISENTYELIKNEFKCDYRGKINAKNKGDIDMYFVNSKI
jgi:adenylate cyclase